MKQSGKERGVNKQGLVDALAQRLKTSKGHSAQIVDALFGSTGFISQELRKGGSLQISGFGTFETRRRAPRRGRDPRSGALISLKGTTVPAFRAGKALKELVNKKR